MKRGCSRQEFEEHTSSSVSLHSSDEEPELSSLSSAKINDTDVAHTMVLLKLVCETEKVRKMKKDTMTAYRYLMVRKSCEAYEHLEAIDSNWRYWSPDKKGKAVVDFLHAGCCDDGMAGETIKCRIDPKLEVDVCACVKQIITKPGYYQKMCRIRDFEDKVVRHSYTSKELKKAIRDLNTFRTHLINKYFPTAAWKRECDKEMTSFEAFITDPDTISAMELLEPDECASVIKYVCGAILCKDNKDRCRGCYGSINSKSIKQKARRKRQGKQKHSKKIKHAKTLMCMDCRSVYFCSEACRITGSMGRHQSIECKMLQEEIQRNEKEINA